MLFLVATVTPFDRGGRLDLGRLRAHILWLAAQGVQGFVPTGSTGEFLYLTDRERQAVHRTVLDAARGLPVYPCVWDPSPSTMTYLCESARENGASGIVVPPPLYYPTEQDLLENWFRGVAEASGLPVLAYHNPTYLPSGIQQALYQKLRRENVIVGMKDISGDPWRLRRFAKQDPGAVFAGGPEVLCEVHRIPGLAGFVSSMANVWPSLCLRAFQGEEQLRDAIIERAVRVRTAGGFRALKALLGMANRVPYPSPSDEALSGLPPSEYP